MKELKAIFVEKDLHTQLKVESAKRGVNLQDMVNVWLRERIANRNHKMVDNYKH